MQFNWKLWKSATYFVKIEIVKTVAIEIIIVSS